MKKPKKKKTKSTRQKLADPDDFLLPELPEQPPQEDKMDVDTNGKDAKKGKQSEDANLVDDDDLQLALSMQRRNALKKRKRTRPEDIAKEVKEASDEQDGASEETGGLVIGEVSEFVAGIKKGDEDEEDRPRKKRPAEQPPAPAVKEEAEEDVPMTNIDAYQPTRDEQKEEIKEEESPEDDDIMEEKTVGQGLGATLSLLRDRGILRDSDGVERHEDFMKKQEFLAKKRRMEAELDEAARQQRERDRASGRLDRMSHREQQEYARQQNAQRDLQASRRMAELFNQEFKPTFEIKYADETGRRLDQKEAFKHLSHQFHGKGSGKGKTDKKLKKIAEEQRKEAQSVLDPGRDVGMSSVTAQQLKKRREAGVRLA